MFIEIGCSQKESHSSDARLTPTKSRRDAMLLPLLCSLALAPTALLVHSSRSASPVMMDLTGGGGSKSWKEAQEKRKAEQAARYQELADRAEAANAEREAALQRQLEEEKAEKERQAAAAASYQDNVDFYRPGGVMRQPTNFLTREALENSRKTQSPRINAMDALQTVIKEKTPTAEGLGRVIDAAVEAGVSDSAPQLRKARALLAALQVASSDAPAKDEATGATQDGGLDSKLNQLFVEEYSMPDLDDDLKF
jgi:hypothetical protein